MHQSPRHALRAKSPPPSRVSVPDVELGHAHRQQAYEAKVDRLSLFWQRMIDRDKKQYAQKMERIRREEEAQPPPPLYMSADQQSLHRLVFKYVDGLRVHEARVERQKAIQDTRNLLQTVVLMEKQ